MDSAQSRGPRARRAGAAPEPAGAGTADSHPLDLFRVASRVHLADPRTDLERLRVELERHREALVRQRAEADRARAMLESAVREAEDRSGRLVAEQLRLGQRANALLETARRFAGTSRLSEVYRVALEAAESQLADAAVFVADCETATTCFSVRACGPRAAAVGERLRGEASPASFGAEIIGGSGPTSVLPDPGYRFDAALLAAGVAAVTAIPVALAAHTGGAGPCRPTSARLPVIVAAWTSAHSCPREDLWFLEQIAGQLALALRATPV